MLTDTERSLCEVLAELFNGVAPHVDDDFFALGMDSIVAISLVHKARRRGIAVSPRMVVTAPTIRQLAAAIDSTADSEAVERARCGTECGEVPPLPMVCWLNEYGNYRRFTHTVFLRLPADIDRVAIESLLQLLLDGHDALRSVLVDTPAGPRLVTREPGVVRAADVLSRVTLDYQADADLSSAITRCARTVTDEIDPRTGATVRAVWLSGIHQQEQVLLLTVHHLAVDVVSWHIIVGDLTEAWRAVTAGTAPEMLPEHTSYRRWSELMWQRAASPAVGDQLEYWAAKVREPDPALGVRHPDPTRDTWSNLQVRQVATAAQVTERVLAALRGDTGVREFLLAVMTMCLSSWRHGRGEDPGSGTLVDLEGHGRADAVMDADTTHTVGWFTSSFPVRLGVGDDAVDVERAGDDPVGALALLDSVRVHLAGIPNGGLDYGLLRYVNRAPGLCGVAEPQIQFSYLGRLDLSGRTDRPWSLLGTPYIDALPVDPEPDLPLRFAITISSAVDTTPQGSQLVTNVLFSDALFAETDIDRLTDLWQRAIVALADALDHE